MTAMRIIDASRFPNGESFLKNILRHDIDIGLIDIVGKANGFPKFSLSNTSYGSPYLDYLIEVQVWRTEHGCSQHVGGAFHILKNTYNMHEREGELYSLLNMECYQRFLDEINEIIYRYVSENCELFEVRAAQTHSVGSP